MKLVRIPACLPEADGRQAGFRVRKGLSLANEGPFILDIMKYFVYVLKPGLCNRNRNESLSGNKSWTLALQS